HVPGALYGLPLLSSVHFWPCGPFCGRSFMSCHAVSRLRAARLERSVKPFQARGSRAVRCQGCRLMPSHCLCALTPSVPAVSGMCLLMHDVEALKPSNTGWLIADVVADTSAFGWVRTA